MDTEQFYATPVSLANKCIAKFKNKVNSESRILEPSAGRGDFIKALTGHYDSRWATLKIDAVEVNISRHPNLRELNAKVVGVDFLSFNTAIGYTHILMNPPFNAGADHVLHAWDILEDGELVAILNAETIKNPYSAKRQQLSKIIELYGNIEYVTGAFLSEDTERTTSVEVAIVYLAKKKSIPFSLNLDGLDQDEYKENEYSNPTGLTIPNSSIRNLVIAFKKAVEAMKASVKASAEASYYSRLIRPIKPVGDDSIDPAPEPKEIKYSDIRSIINERYDELKENAWRSVLQTADFSSRFSNNVRNKIEKEISNLISLEFTEENVQGLLLGLLSQKGELDIQVLEDTFDNITKYHSDNIFYYMGWKSNDKHRLGFKLKHTRFIIPRLINGWVSRYISSEGTGLIKDIDRCFHMLDGKHYDNSASPAEIAINNNPDAIRLSDRLDCGYFDIRVYPGIGTIHFFPKRKDLIERLNRIVGKRRQWLPDDVESAPDVFKDQYAKADKLTKAMEKVRKPSRWYREDYSDSDYAEACKLAELEPWTPLMIDVPDNVKMLT